MLTRFTLGFTRVLINLTPSAQVQVIKTNRSTSSLCCPGKARRLHRRSSLFPTSCPFYIFFTLVNWTHPSHSPAKSSLPPSNAKNPRSPAHAIGQRTTAGIAASQKVLEVFKTDNA
ncbi:hypothetical protein AVEN_118602-1 [Araneus ventricosus]|uniref:Uncharacterized protein n=1 Tax=Araneus ventricosus TaxID=182803 RepID=A0A4Y2AVW1_ARAVE|nr:hypothetical protein AVEN_118602-1 [Araneus ventricosus]